MYLKKRINDIHLTLKKFNFTQTIPDAYNFYKQIVK